MIGLGTLINTGAIIAGGLLARLVGPRLKERHQNTLTVACGVSTLFVGVAGAMEGMLKMENGGIASKNGMLVVICLTLGALIGGKYLAACTVLLMTAAVSFVYCLIVAVYGTLYLGETMVGYLGLILQGCAFIALDLFISCFARSQMTAAVAGVGMNLLVWFSDVVASAVTVRWIGDGLKFISLYQRFAPFARGQLSFSNVLFYCLFIGIMLFLSVRVIDSRRWSEA